jgi:hypothetical protein
MSANTVMPNLTYFEAQAAPHVTTYAHDASGKRVDIHRPSAINPADYTYIGVYENRGPRRKSAILGGPAGTCHHCGKAIVYEAHFLYTPDNTRVTFGWICADLLQMVDSRARLEFERLKAAAARRAQALKDSEANAAKRAQFDADYPELAKFLDELDLEEEKSFFVRDMHRARDQWGSLTTGQREALERTIAKREAALAERVRRALNDPVPTEPLAAGRYQMEGEIVWVKAPSAEDQFPAWRMRVMLKDGNKVWGTMPASLVDAKDNPMDMKGENIKFTALVKPKNGEPHFGFFNRPSNAVVV